MLVGAACASDDDATTTDTQNEPTASTVAPATDSTDSTDTSAPAEPLAVEQLTLDLVDSSRPTPAGASTAATDTRPLPTIVRYPAEGGPWPLIVFAHGLSGHPDKFSGLLETWASAGFVVAAPTFPLTNGDVVDSWSNFADVANQPADLSFVTDEVLAANADPDSPLADRVDPERIGFGGLSLGGATTYLAGLNEATRDPRVDAAMVLDGVAFDDAATGTFLEPSGTPAFLVHCDEDPLAPLRIATDAYALLAPPKYLVVMDGVCHAEAFEDTPHELDAIATEITTRFWDAYLAGAGPDGPDPAALEALQATLDGADLLTPTSELP